MFNRFFGNIKALDMATAVALGLLVMVLLAPGQLLREQTLGAQVSTSWVVSSAPAANTQAVASRALTAAKSHVAECVMGVLAAGTAAPTATTATLNLRDGATGAGSVLAAWTLALPATAGLLSPPISECGLGILGTPGTAMTLEFAAASGANTFQSVTLKGRTQ